MASFTDEIQLESLLEKLHNLKSELDDEIVSLQQESQPVQLDQQAFGRVSRGEALQQQNMAKANLIKCQERLRQIDAALAKIDAEDYGFCDECGESITTERLSARPESPLCIQCQEKKEQADS